MIILIRKMAFYSVWYNEIPERERNTPTAQWVYSRILWFSEAICRLQNKVVL